MIPITGILRGHFQQINLEEPDSSLAEFYFRNAIALNPMYTDAWLDLGTGYELEGNTKAASKAFLQAEHSYPSSAEVAWRYGNFLLRNGDRPQAYVKFDARSKRIRSARSGVFACYRGNPDIDAILNQALPAKHSVYVDVIGLAARTKQLAVGKAVWERLFRMHPRLQLATSTLLSSDFCSRATPPKHGGSGTRGCHDGLPQLLSPKDSVVWDPSFESGRRILLLLAIPADRAGSEHSLTGRETFRLPVAPAHL